MKKLMICIDGCGPDYLRYADTPFLDTLAREGRYQEVKAIVPTVTNVNNVSIVTGGYPDDHGITGNYFRDETGHEQYMESKDFLLCPTLFQRLEQQGKGSAIFTVKDKLRTLIGAGASISISAEKPPSWLVEKLGPPPPVYSLEVNHWLVLALGEMIRKGDEPYFVYLSTSDYPQHKHAPADEQAQYYLSRFDRLLGEIISNAGELDMAITADHGMGPKTRALDPAKILTKYGIQAEAVPIIKDRYVAHHGNLGGAAYVYLANSETTSEAMEMLRQQEGVESVLSREEAQTRYHLLPSRIGDLFVLATNDTVFGNLDAAEEEATVRSHGSLHEQIVPLIACGQSATRHAFVENKDAASFLFP
jgi:phosphonoacetate hydrolase